MAKPILSQSPSPAAESVTILSTLGAIEDALNRDEKSDALEILQNARAVLTPPSTGPATEPVTSDFQGNYTALVALTLSQGYDRLLEAESLLHVLDHALHDRCDENDSADYSNVIDAVREKLRTTWEALDNAGFNTCTALKLERQEADHV